MPWQEMTALLRELRERCLEQLTILSAQISDIKTRLDDLETSVGELQDDGVRDPDESYELEQTGTHPPNCRCAWCEPGDGTAWGS